MTWDKPKTSWQWLALLIPAGICVLSSVAGGLFGRENDGWIGWTLLGLVVAICTSLGQSIWLARVNTSLGAKVGCALVCFMVLMIVDCTVSFAGCAVLGTAYPIRIDMRLPSPGAAPIS
jgi:hypothetical protein